MTAESRKELMNAQTAKGIFCAEVKTENLINRSVGMAEPPPHPGARPCRDKIQA
ncbi:MAG: hypothetical protein L6R45_15040 [Anaerolineae bacterium]|nr:hypothetical protein [Anaerolineae bacterium]